MGNRGSLTRDHLSLKSLLLSRFSESPTIYHSTTSSVPRHQQRFIIHIPAPTTIALLFFFPWVHGSRACRGIVPQASPTAIEKFDPFWVVRSNPGHWRTQIMVRTGAEARFASGPASGLVPGRALKLSPLKFQIFRDPVPSSAANREVRSLGKS